MRGLLIKAERILGYMQICRKYETQDEKILPIVDNHPTIGLSIADDDDDDDNDDDDEDDDDGEDDVLPLQTVTAQIPPIRIRS